jgi:Zn-dependent protease with chaperone function
MADARGRRIVAMAIAVGVAGSAVGSAVYIWGPLHTAYERVCDGLPFLRLLGPIPLSLLATAILAGFVAGALTLLQVVRDSRRMIQQVDLLRAPRAARLERVAESLGLGGRCQLIHDVGMNAFCHGMYRPTVYVTTGLLAVLNDAELRAVLAHERGHLVSRDPLRTTMGRVLSRLLLFIPLHEEASGPHDDSVGVSDGFHGDGVRFAAFGLNPDRFQALA